MAQQTGFITATDSALKEKLSGITVSDDQRSDRPVRVFYRWPDSDIENLYPFITIELIDVQHAMERESSAQTIYARAYDAGPFGDPMAYLEDPSRLPYWPDTTPNVETLTLDPSGYQALIELTPVNFIYRISTHARNQYHDRQLAGKMLSRGRLPFRYGELFVDADDTVRRLENLGWQQADFSDNEVAGHKRIFRKIYTVSVNGELGFDDFRGVGTVSTVQIDVTGGPWTFGSQSE